MPDNLPPRPPVPPAPTPPEAIAIPEPAGAPVLGGLEDISPETEQRGFGQKIKEFFSDRRKVIIVAILLLLLALLLAFLLLRGGGDNVSNAPGQNNNNTPGFPIEGQFEPDINPLVYRPGDGTVVVTWDTKTESDGRVSYGLTTDYGFFADDQDTLHPSQYSTNHTVILRGLDSSQTYHLLASSLDKDGNVYYSQDIEVQPIADNQPPTIVFVVPKNGDTLSGVAKILPKADDDQGVFSLVFSVDNQPQEVRRRNFNDHFALDTRLLANGAHTLSLVASDGANVARAEVSVNVENLNAQNQSGNISINITAPTPNQVITGQQTARAEAADSSGAQITRIDYFINGLKQGQSNGSPASFTINASQLNDGRHVVGFRATNNSGNFAYKQQFFVVDNDGRADSDNDGIPDTEDDNLSGDQDDFDNDGIPNINDPDDDNDGIPDNQDDDDNNNGIPDDDEGGINPGGSGNSIFVSNVNASTTLDSIALSWQTSANSTSVVEWGLDLNYGQKAEDTTQTQTHSMVISGLNPGTTYFLRISGTGGNGAVVDPYRTFAITKNTSGGNGNNGGGNGGNNGGNNDDDNGGLPPGAPPNCQSLDTVSFVTLTEPANNKYVKDTVKVASTIQTAKTLVGVSFLIDGQVFASDDTSPYEVDLDTHQYANGDRTLKAVAHFTDNSCSNWEDGGLHTVTVVIENPLLTLNSVSSTATDIYSYLKFRSSEQVSAQIRYGTNRSNLNQTLTTSAFTTPNFSYQVLLKNLSPATTYYYQIITTNTADPTRRATSTLDNFTTRNKPVREDMTAAVTWQAPCSGAGTVYYDRYPENTSLAQYTGSAFGGTTTAAVTGPVLSQYSYTAILTGLQSGVEYHYRYVTSCQGNAITPALTSPDFTFTTPAN